MKRIIFILVVFLNMAALRGEGYYFSINNKGEAVIFSPGNLQYNARADYRDCADGENKRGLFKFAANQWDIVGSNNDQISVSYDHYIDLFGWATSGWDDPSDHDVTNFEPWSSGLDNGSPSIIGYGPPCIGGMGQSLTGAYGYYDWGVYNPIGSDPFGTWRLMTRSEWEYLYARTDVSGNLLRASGTIESRDGLILLPDNWVLPAGASFSASSSNNYTATEWAVMEGNGAIFLPYTGYRTKNDASGNANKYISSLTKYWLSTCSYAGISCSSADAFYPNGGSVDIHCSRYEGYAVRLVRDTTVMKRISIKYDTICVGDSVKWQGVFRTEGGIYIDTVVSARTGLRDSIVALSLYEYTNPKFYFTVDETSGRKVVFSPGNLQFKATAGQHLSADSTFHKGTWRFATRQYDFVGGTTGGNVYEAGSAGTAMSYNERVAENYDGWIDMFGWATSGWNNTSSDPDAINYEPWSKSTAEVNPPDNYYGYGPSVPFRRSIGLTGSNKNYDWGQFNSIQSGDKIEAPDTWRTLDRAEWVSLFAREDASGNKTLFGRGTINYKVGSSGEKLIAGLIILPDNWVLPTGLSFTGGDAASETDNVYTEDQWALMEANGAIFLPYGGFRETSASPITTRQVGEGAYYWTASSESSLSSAAYFFQCDNAWMGTPVNAVYTGYAVRLVQDVKTTTRIWEHVDSMVVLYPGDTCYFNGHKYYQPGKYTELVGTVGCLREVVLYVGFSTPSEHPFSVCPDGSRKVVFSPGNLQFNAAEGYHKTADGKIKQGTWRFAEHQWDVVGDKSQTGVAGNVYHNGVRSDNHNASATYNGWIDQFGWGTSGYDNITNDPNATRFEPWETVTSIVNAGINAFGYGPSTNMPSKDLTGESKYYDWGQYNEIKNGSQTDSPGTWRVLTKDDVWAWAFSTDASNYSGSDRRANAINLFGLGIVNDVYGFILLPDDWKLPDGLSFCKWVGTGGCPNYSANIYTRQEWFVMESNGAVFLPIPAPDVEESDKILGRYWLAEADKHEPQRRANVFSFTPVKFSGSTLVDIERLGISDHTGRHGYDLDNSMVCRPNVRLVREYIVPKPIYADTIICAGTVFHDDGAEGYPEQDYEPGEYLQNHSDRCKSPRVLGVYEAPRTQYFFTVDNTGKSVFFSPGNLQYNTTGTHRTKDARDVKGRWRFAVHQWDYIGNDEALAHSYGNVYSYDGKKCSNSKIGADYEGWIDLFGAGTSGKDGKYPYQFTINNANYIYDQDIAGTDDDWGRYNQIENYTFGTWRTMTYDEWMYIFKERERASDLCGRALVNGVGGLVLLPDNWILPEGLTFIAGLDSGTFGNNAYNGASWRKMEDNGAIFLPITGYRYHKMIPMAVESAGFYWTATRNGRGTTGNKALREICFTGAGSVYSVNTDNYNGRAVRLVQDYAPAEIPWTKQTICEGDSLEWPFGSGKFRKTAGVYFDTTSSLNKFGCDEVKTLVLKVETLYCDTLSRTICNGEKIEWYGKTYTKPGLYKEVRPSATCDSIRYLDLTVIYVRDTVKQVFAVSKYDSVYFAPGNLQFNAQTGSHQTADGKTKDGTWRFAEHQWDFVGGTTYEGSIVGTVADGDNSKIGNNYNGWIDLFGWGTSGWNNTANDACARNYQPWASSTSSNVCLGTNDYGYGPSINRADIHLTGTSAFADWGQYNAIENGLETDSAGTWRVLSAGEWDYLLHKRNYADSLWGEGEITTTDGKTINGLILLPDGWKKRSDLPSFIPKASSTSAFNNKYTVAQWEQLEAYGAVFLPCAGERGGTYYDSLSTSAYYWSSSVNQNSTEKSREAISLSINGTKVSPNTARARSNGHCVRLVKKYESPVHHEIGCPGDTFIWRGQLVSRQGIYADTMLSEVTGCDSVVYLYFSTYLEYKHPFILKDNDGSTTTDMTGENLDIYGAIFSPGNLQYNAMLGEHRCQEGIVQKGTFRFAEHQWDYVGDISNGTVYHNGVKSNNAQIAEDYDGWIDLFGWGTSGYCDTMILYDQEGPGRTHSTNNEYHTNFQPWSSSTAIVKDPENKYGYGPSDCKTSTGNPLKYDLIRKYYDWGDFNAILNNGVEDAPGTGWKTFLLNTRSQILWSKLHCRRDKTNSFYLNNPGSIKVNGTTTVNGVIMLPDDWETPAGIPWNGADNLNNYTTNSYTVAQWQRMEERGAVFLPAAGRRKEKSISDVNSYGYYWSAERADTTTRSKPYSNGTSIFAWAVRIEKYMSNASMSSSEVERYWGNSVRLARTYVCENYRVVCPDSTFEWNGEVFNREGRYTRTLMSVNGCDSVVTLILAFYPVPHDTIDSVKHRGQVIRWEGNDYTERGYYTDTLTSRKTGCDSIVTLHCIFVDDVNQLDTIWKDDTYAWHGKYFNRAGVYHDTIMDSEGLDSIYYTLQLTVVDRYYDTIRVASCETMTQFTTKDGVIIHIPESGSTMKTDTIRAKDEKGRRWKWFSKPDTVRTHIVDRGTNFRIENTVRVCRDSSYTWDKSGKTYEYTFPYSSTYDETVVPYIPTLPLDPSLTARDTCDTTFVLHIIWTPRRDDSLIIQYLCPNETIYVGGVPFSGASLLNAGKIVDITPHQEGLECKSPRQLVLKKREASVTTSEATICDGDTYTFSGIPIIPQKKDSTYTFIYSNQAGCDSIVKFTLHVLDRYFKDTTRTICEHDTCMFAGEMLSEAGIYQKTFTAANGCDSIVTLQLKVLPDIEIEREITFCGDEFYTHKDIYGTHILHEPDSEYIFRYEASGTGCDSVVHFHVKRYPTSFREDTASICGGSVYNFHGWILQKSGIYYDTLRTAHGCDSIVGIRLTVAPIQYDTVRQFLCGDDSFAIHAYYHIHPPATVHQTLFSQTGCDSIYRTYIINVGQENTVETSHTICKGDVYEWRGQICDTAGIYSDTVHLYELSDSTRCDSIYRLRLLVDSIPITYIDTTICPSDYVFYNGRILNAGVYFETFPGLHCDSVVCIRIKNYPSYSAAEPHHFSVSAEKKVFFASGNLQFNAAQGAHLCADGSIQKGTWRFAEHQWDYVGDATRGTVYQDGVGCDNSLVSATYNGWIDLFCGGMSGYNGYFPYLPNGIPRNININDSYYDWGVYNSSGLGGGSWRTPTFVEWEYVLDKRANAWNLHGYGRVNGINGMIILPDNWILPEGLNFVAVGSEYGNTGFNKNVFDLDAWSKMEAHGAVFLPTGGRRDKDNVIKAVGVGYYWSSTTGGDGTGDRSLKEMCFVNANGDKKEWYSLNNDNSNGRAVRLVKDYLKEDVKVLDTVQMTICEGDPAIWNGIDYSLNPDYKKPGRHTITQTLPTIHGCDSTLCLDLQVLPTIRVELRDTGCYGVPYTALGDLVLTESGTYTYTTQSLQYDCDSTTILHLVMGPTIKTTERVYLCENDSIVWENVPIYPHFFKFSVNGSGRSVSFSPGNLQFNAMLGEHLTADDVPAKGTFRFAEHQWDFVGDKDLWGTVYHNGSKCDNARIADNYDGWIDLFGWGTSGWNSEATAYQPWSASANAGDYVLGGEATNDLTGDFAKADWGQYNQIGTDTIGTWRTLTEAEWEYLLERRDRRNNYLCGQGQITFESGLFINGFIILPDGWQTPNGVSFTGGKTLGSWTTNTYSEDQWSIMETNGAIFLPCGGYRAGNMVSVSGRDGYYWSATAANDEEAIRQYFNASSAIQGNSRRHLGLSVRLVRDNSEKPIFEDTIIRTPGVYTKTFTSQMYGCDSVHTITVSRMVPLHTFDSVYKCSNDEYYFYGTRLHNDTDCIDTLFSRRAFSDRGCDSVYRHLHLEVFPWKERIENVQICPNENMYITPAGHVAFMPTNVLSMTFRDTFHFAYKRVTCDSIITYHISRSPSIYIEKSASICAGETYDWHGQLLTKTGDYQDKNQTVDGCDSIYVLHLTVRDTATTKIERNICFGDSTYFKDLWLKSDTTLRDTLHSSLMCDSIVELRLTVYFTKDSTYNDTICEGESYPFNGYGLLSAGTHTHHAKTAYGCDSSITVNLTVLPKLNVYQLDTICVGEAYTGLSDTILTTSGTYHQTRPSAQYGCDSVTTIHLTVLPMITERWIVALCKGDSFKLNDLISDTVLRDDYPQRIYRRFYPKASSLNCDSMLEITVTVGDTFFYRLDKSIKSGEVYNFNGRRLMTSGLYRDSFKTQSGCDSIYELKLDVKGVVTYDAISYTFCESESRIITLLSGKAVEVKRDTTFIEEVRDAKGVLTHQRTYTVRTQSSFMFEQQIHLCETETYSWRGRTVLGSDGSQTYEESIPSSVEGGCDTLYRLIVSAHDTSMLYRDTTVCPKDVLYLYDQRIMGEEDYTFHLPTATACDCTVVWHVAYYENKFTDLGDSTICEGDYVVFREARRFQAGDYYDTLVSHDGCDSIVHLHITVNPSYHQTHQHEFCAPERSFTVREGLTLTIPDNTSSYTYVDSLKTAEGCDDIHTYILVQKPTYFHSEKQRVCSNKPFTWHGTTYTKPGTYTFDASPAANGCDSIFELILIHEKADTVEIDTTICPGDWIYLGNERISEPKTYTKTLKKMSCGCDSFVTIHLSHHPSYPEVLIEKAICEGDFYELGSSFLNKPDDYYLYLKTVNGCDSIIHLRLSVSPIHDTEFVPLCGNNTWSNPRTGEVIFDPSNNTPLIFNDTVLGVDGGCEKIITYVCQVEENYYFKIEELTCDNIPYIWRGQPRTETRVYKEQTTSPLGCDSTFILDLKFNYHIETDTTIYICSTDYLVFGDKVITQEGDYRSTFPAVYGCDSTVTLHVRYHDEYHIEKSATICEGEKVQIDASRYLTEPGTYVYNDQTQNGCDSITTWHIKRNKTYIKDTFIITCPLDKYVIEAHDGPIALEPPCIYYDRMKTVNGCDSVIKYILSVDPTYLVSETINICQGASYRWRDTIVNTPGTYYRRFKTGKLECDSIYELVFDNYATYKSTLYDTVKCSNMPYFWQNKYYLTESGYYVDSIRTDNGCDSIIELYLTVCNTYLFRERDTICDLFPYTWRDKTYTTSGTYYDNKPTKAYGCGCDSTYMLELVSVPTPHLTVYDTICYGDSAFLEQDYQKRAGIYYDSLFDPIGLHCETRETHLFVFMPEHLRMTYIDIPPFCADDSIFYIYSDNEFVRPKYYFLSYDEPSQAAGFRNIYNGSYSTAIPVEIPQYADYTYLPPDYYSVRLAFNFARCYNDTNKYDLTFQANYPSNILYQTQEGFKVRYLLSQTGGYKFDNFRWYVNGEEVFGANGKVLPAAEYRVGDQVQVGIIRRGESDNFLSCPVEAVSSAQLLKRNFSPDDNAASINVAPTLVPLTDCYTNVYASENGVYEIYDNLGRMLQSGFFFEYEITAIPLPPISGCYVLQVKTASCASTIKIIVE